MNFPVTPHLRLDETLGHPVDPMVVAGFHGRDKNNGNDAIVLKGSLLPGDDCVGIYNTIEDRVKEDGLTLFVLTEKAVHGVGRSAIHDAPPHTFHDVPLFEHATMSCVPLEDFDTWDRNEVTIE